MNDVSNGCVRPRLMVVHESTLGFLTSTCVLRIRERQLNTFPLKLTLYFDKHVAPPCRKSTTQELPRTHNKNKDITSYLLKRHLVTIASQNVTRLFNNLVSETGYNHCFLRVRHWSQMIVTFYLSHAYSEHYYFNICLLVRHNYY